MSLGREVALKLMLGGRFASRRSRQRFRREAETVARLQHPNIAQVHDHGEVDGLPYLVEELVPGGTLARRIHRNPQPPREIAQLVETLATAVHYAHQNNVIHRDLKPSNVLLTEAGQPKIADFGLAKAIDVDGELTQSGEAPGTPNYMAPEQVSQGKIGPATDVYALGAILFEMLIGRPPFQGDSPNKIYAQILNDPPQVPPEKRKKLPADLLAIALKCLEKESKRRYESATALARDLRRWLDGEATEARPISAIEQIWRTIKRRPLISTLIGALVLLLITSAIGSTVAAVAIAHARDDAGRNAAAEHQARTLADAALESERSQRKRAERAETDAVKAAKTAQAEARKAEQVAQFLAGIFQSSDPAGLGGIGLRRGGESIDQVTARQLLDRGVEQIDKQLQDQPLVRASLLDTLGNVYRSLGVYEPAEKLLREALALRQKQLPTDDVELAASLHHVGWLLHDLGQPEEAEPLLRQAMEILRRRYSDDDLRVADVKFNLAWALRDQSSHFSHVDEAKALLEQVLTVRRNTLGETHRDVGITLSALMALALDKSDEEGAKRLGLEALNIFLQQDGGEVLGQAMIAYNDAVLQRREANFSRAEQLYRQTLDLTKQFLGPEHPVVVLLLGDLAGMQREACNLSGAEDTLRESLKIAQKLYPKGHPRIVEPLRELAQACAGRGENVEAEQLLSKAFEICRANSSSTQLTAADVLKDYAEIVAVLGKIDEAQALLQEAIDHSRILYPDIPRAGNGELDRLAMILHAAGRDAEADAIWQSLIATGQDAFAETHFAAARLDRGILDGTEKLLAHVVQWAEVKEEPRHRFAKSPEFLTYCRFLLLTGRPDRAEPISRDILALRESRCTRGHWHIAEAKALLGAALLKQGNLDEARPLLTEAHQTLQKILGAEHKVTKEAAGYLAALDQAGDKTAKHALQSSSTPQP